MVVRLHIGIKSRSVSCCSYFLYHAVLLQGAQVAIHGIEGYGWNAALDSLVDCLGVGMFLSPCQFPEDLRPLVRYSHTCFPTAFDEIPYALG